MYESIIAAGSILHYLGQNKHQKLQHISSLKRIDENTHVWLDQFTIRNLELVNPANENGVSLFDIIDCSSTPMGSRMLKQWILFPLKNVEDINERLNIVDFFHHNRDMLHDSISYLKEIGDMERMLAKISTLRISPRELNRFKNSLIISGKLQNLLAKNKDVHVIKNLFSSYHDCTVILSILDSQLDDDAPVALSKGNTIKNGVNKDLDSYRELEISSEKILDKIKNREIENTGISSLKISYNNIFGYYLEVRNTHKDKVPENWIRKQTLVSAERYITQELKDLEVKIISAKENIHKLESEIYFQLVSSIVKYITPVQYNAHILAKIDCLVSFSLVSSQNKYCKPTINESFKIDIVGGRHPVIESQLKNSHDYVPNDLYLDTTMQKEH